MNLRKKGTIGCVRIIDTMKNQVIELYNGQSGLIERNSAGLFNLYRKAAFERLQTLSMPTLKDEAYLYCPLLDKMEVEWGVNLNRTKFGLKAEEMFHCAIPGIKATMAYMLNDVWGGECDEIVLGEGAFVTSMKAAWLNHREIVEKYYGSALHDEKDAFVAVNEVLVQDGVMIYVPKGKNVKVPLQVVNMLWSGRDMMVVNRNLFVVEDGAELQLIDCDHAMDKNRYFAIRMNEACVGDGAKFTYCTMESTEENVFNLRRFAVSAGRSSIINMSSFGIVCGATRNHIEVDLNGEGADVWLGGVLLASNSEKCENYTIIRHHVSNCTSNELYKYILDGEAKAGFSGRIVVDHGAQKTVSYQTNRNVLLSDTAKVMGRPQLEIYADDVKCGHGATTGMLDEMAIFYMRQRGIGLEEARMLLLQAFAADVVAHIENNALQDRLRLMIEKRLKGEGTSCVNCGKL